MRLFRSRQCGSIFALSILVLAAGTFSTSAQVQGAPSQDSQQSFDQDEASQGDSQQGAAVDEQSQDQGESTPLPRVRERARRKGKMRGPSFRKDPAEAASDASSEALSGNPSPGRIRRFYEVLDELLAEFGYDVKSGQIKGLANVSIRKVRVSQAIPKTYEEYIETLLSERMREQSQVKIISCVPCKTRTSSLVDGQLMISSPSTNLAKLDAAAASLGIDNFMDVVLVYHTTHMVLAIDIFDTKTKELVWARTYNSETVRSRYQKLAVDYSQIAKSRPTDEYVPDFRYLIGLGGGAIPNVAGTKDDSTMLNVQVRATEKFNNRKDEFGLLFSVLRSTKSLLKSYPSEKPNTAASKDPPAVEEKVVKTTPKPFSSAMGLYGLYSHIFLGNVESYDRLRHGLHFGLGGLFTTGYLAPAVRSGWDLYLGRRFVTTFGFNYIGQSSIVIETKSTTTKGGFGADIILSVSM